MKKLTAILLTLALMAALTGCGGVVGDTASAVKSFISGDVTGELNKTYSTQWFDFTIKTIKTAYEYAGYEAGDGYKFVDVVVSETNTFEEPIPMGYWDFELAAEGLPEEDTVPLEPLDETCMPEEFVLKVGETEEYHVLFTIPDEITDISFIYEEIDEDDNVGATFTIKHSL
jgi:uncharacterized protein YceK